MHSDAEIKEIEVEKGIRIRDIYIEHMDEIPNTILLAKIDNKYVSLMERIEEPCRVELIDMRSHVGRLVYQHGMIMIYLKAIEETMGRQKVEVQYALSKGLYTEINGGEEISDAALEAIRQRMQEIVEKDMQFIKR
jgi:uridine kinase